MADNGNTVLDGLYLLAKSLPNIKTQAKAYIEAIIGTVTTAASVAWADITGKPTTFPPDTHTHIPGDITGGLTAAQITDLTDGGQTTLHTHAGGGGYTDEEAQDAVGTILTDTATIDFTYTDATPTIEASVKAASITEAMQVLADNTTNDVSATKHGYAPKAPNTTTTFLRGDATWATPPSGLTITNFSTYANLLADTSVAAGQAGTVTGLAALFIKLSATLADWIALAKAYVWAPGANTKWFLQLENDVTDDSGNSYDATATDVTYVAGKVGAYAGNFNGTSSKATYSACVTGAAITNITLMCWVYLSSTSLKGCFIVMGSNESAGYITKGFSLGVGSTTADLNGNNLIALYDGVRWIPSGIALGTGWVHVALTVNGSSKPTLYKNGQPVFSDTGTNPSAPTATSPSTNIGGAVTNRFFAGYIDDVIIENRLWTAQEIADYYYLTR